ncbi:MAG TPA: hypothetical protein VKU93_01215, partial [Terracidiphilus sp.]|nr:hypothetical protein [Terracidiphilus sp.]
TAFARLYADNLARKYSSVKAEHTSVVASAAEAGAVEQVFSTDEGPVTITTRGSLVFVAESFPLPLARKLAVLILNDQGTGDVRTAQIDAERPAGPEFRPLGGDLAHFFQNCGVTKAAVEAILAAAR